MTSDLQALPPRHVCIIMDGNGRWARKRLMPRSFGHRKGVEATRRAIEFFARAGVEHLTLFAFSSENWNRPADEVSQLMELFLQSLESNTSELREQGIRIRFIGDRARFDARLRAQIEESERLTRDNRRLMVNVAVNYGGHWDLVQAARALARRVAAGELEADAIDPARFAAELALGDCPDADLFIRTGGERRISNFLLWQLAYTEFYFCDTLWPDFSEPEMQQALDEFARRQRRFGKTGEQLEGAT